MDLKNSTILITGGTSGIGLELVKQLSELGATILITGRGANALAEARKKFPQVHTFQSDVSKPEDIEQLYRDVITRFPDLNIIINNAGLMRLIDLQDPGPALEHMNQEIATNLSGTIWMVHRFLPHLIKQKSAAIVNVSSGIALMSYSAAPIYSATKAGVRAYTQALRLQLQDTQVKVFEMIPPGVNTNLQNDWKVQPEQNQMMDVDKMVRVAIKGLLYDQKELKPFLIRVVQAMSRIAPGFLLKYAHREFKKIKALDKVSGTPA